MQQIYRRTKVLNLQVCSPINVLHIFKTPFHKNTYGGLLLYYVSYIIFRKQLGESEKNAATKGKSKAAGCMAANLLKLTSSAKKFH